MSKPQDAPSTGKHVSQIITPEEHNARRRATKAKKGSRKGRGRINLSTDTYIGGRRADLEQRRQQEFAEIIHAIKTGATITSLPKTSLKRLGAETWLDGLEVIGRHNGCYQEADERARVNLVWQITNLPGQHIEKIEAGFRLARGLMLAERDRAKSQDMAQVG